jgi:hypothetical protein
VRFLSPRQSSALRNCGLRLPARSSDRRYKPSRLQRFEFVLSAMLAKGFGSDRRNRCAKCAGVPRPIIARKSGGMYGNRNSDCHQPDDFALPLPMPLVGFRGALRVGDRGSVPGQSGDGGAVLGSAETRAPQPRLAARSPKTPWSGSISLPTLSDFQTATMAYPPSTAAVRHFTAAARMAAEPRISRWVDRMAAAGLTEPLRLGTRSRHGRWAPRGAPLHGGRQQQIRGSVPSHGARVLEVRIRLPPL